MAGAGGSEVGRISIRVVPDTDRFRKDLQAEVDAAEKEVRGTVNFDSDLDTQGAKEHMRILLDELKAQARAAHVQVNVDVDQNLIKNGLETSLSSLATNLESVGQGSEFAGQQFMGMSRMGWLVVAVLAAAAPAIGLVAGLLAGLPSLVLGAALPMGALVLGLKGIQKAAEATGLFSEGKKGGKGGPGAGIIQLQAAVSSVFEKGLTPVFQQLLTLMPTLQAGFVGIAGSLVGMAQGLTNIVTSTAGLAQIQTIFTNVGGLMTAMTPVVSSFLQTFITLGAEGSKSFQLLVAPLSQFASQFEQMINKVSANGTLQASFQGLSQVLGSVLNLFTKLFESGLTAMGQLGGPLSTLVDGLGNLLISLMPALTSLSGLIGNVGGALANALAPVITALTPAFTQLANLLTQDLVVGLQLVTPILTQLAGALGGVLLTAINALIPIMPQMVTMFQQMSTAISGQLAESLPQLAAAFGQMLTVLIPLIPQLQQLLIQAILPMVPALGNLAVASIPLVQAFATILTAVAPLLSGMVQLGGYISSGLGAAITFVVGGLAFLENAFVNSAKSASDFATAIINGAQQALAALQALPGQIQAAFSNFGSLLVSAGKDLIQGLINGITSMVGAAVSAATNLAGQVAGAVKGALGIHSPSVVFHGIGQDTMAGFTNGLDEGGQAVIQKAKDIAAQITDSMNKGIAISPQTVQDLKTSLQQLNLEGKQLAVSRDQTTDPNQKKALTDQINQVNVLKRQLGLQQDQLGVNKKNAASTDSQSQAAQLITSALAKGIDTIKGFASANIQQFGSDIGIGGHGAVEAIGNYGLGFLTQSLNGFIQGQFGTGGGTQIHVNNSEDAVATKQSLDAKAAMQFAGR